MEAILNIDLPGIRKVKSGKVREVFDLGDALLLVATDRISAFDCVMPNGIPRKGEILTQLSFFWFDRFKNLIPNQLIAWPGDPLPPSLAPYSGILSKRAMLVKKANPLPVECVVRGYLAGSGWKEYRSTQSVCGIRLPPGLREADELPEPIFTPATKAQVGHDENISFEQVEAILGPALANRVREYSLALYRSARDYARSRGIIIADTKFEFGLYQDELILIDEVLTPDSSRFWPADTYEAGKPQPSFDKQFVRDYLESIHWNKMPPAPVLPADVVVRTQQKYMEAYERLTGRSL
ncbi:MAG: phosphoribosylaminoimidazolesuccinocarboxamide synthase [Verrucomicrobiae bacterium]|nr:phosphoribosylaminoimidazolesuccinocarboxamide synthase [Verrucomicrobiae bacterium]